MTQATIDSIPHTGWLSIYQITGRKATATTPEVKGIMPVGRSTWLKGVKAGRFPQPAKFGARLVLWKAEDVRLVVENGGAIPTYVRKPDLTGSKTVGRIGSKKAAKEQAAAA